MIAMLTPSRLLCFLLIFATSGIAMAEPVSTGSKTGLDHERKLIVVADLSAGAYYAEHPDCSKPDVLCMDPPPFWFNASISSTVYGTPPPPKIRVNTNSHYGMNEYKYMKGPQLVLLRTNGIAFSMPRYSRKLLIRDKNGELYVRTFASKTVSWLPCETATLREEIFPADFDTEGLEIEKDDYDNYEVTTRPSMYLTTRKGAWPRYAISVERLRDFLEKAGPDITFACKSA
jgi:hypothetical protein